MDSMISLLFMMENRQFHSFIIITMILIATHDSANRWGSGRHTLSVNLTRAKGTSSLDRVIGSAHADRNRCGFIAGSEQRCYSLADGLHSVVNRGHVSHTSEVHAKTGRILQEPRGQNCDRLSAWAQNGVRTLGLWPDFEDLGAEQSGKI